MPAPCFSWVEKVSEIPACYDWSWQNCSSLLQLRTWCLGLVEQREPGKVMLSSSQPLFKSCCQAAGVSWAGCSISAVNDSDLLSFLRRGVWEKLENNRWSHERYGNKAMVSCVWGSAEGGNFFSSPLSCWKQKNMNEHCENTTSNFKLEEASSKELPRNLEQLNSEFSLVQKAASRPSCLELVRKLHRSLNINNKISVCQGCVFLSEGKVERHGPARSEGL